MGPNALWDTNVDRLTEKDILWFGIVFMRGETVQPKSAGRIIALCKVLYLTVVVKHSTIQLSPVKKFPFFQVKILARGGL